MKEAKAAARAEKSAAKAAAKAEKAAAKKSKSSSSETNWDAIEDSSMELRVNSSLQSLNLLYLVRSVSRKQ